MCSITLNASESMNGSCQPNRYGTMIRCPDEDTGRNSVSPWTIPMTSAWATVSIQAPHLTADGCGVRRSAADAGVVGSIWGLADFLISG